MLEMVASVGGTVLGSTRCLTEEDLKELQGCLDLGFGFAYNEIPGQELCYSMTRSSLEQQRLPGHLDWSPQQRWRPSRTRRSPDLVKSFCCARFWILDDAKVRGFLCYFGLKSLNF
jgi:hypothetical protein